MKVNVNLKKWMTLLLTTGTIALSMAACEGHPKDVREESVSTLQQEDQDEVQTTKTSNLQVSLYKQDGMIFIEPCNEEDTFTSEDYKCINSNLAATTNTMVILREINVENLDFSKLNATHIETLKFDHCKGSVAVQNLKAWKELTTLKFVNTDFKQIDALSSLKAVSIEKEKNFSYHFSLNQFFEALEKTSVDTLSISGFSVSHVPLPLRRLDVTYADKESIPNSFHCSAEALTLSISTIQEEEKPPLPVILNDAKDKKFCEFYKFNLRVAQDFDWNQYTYVCLIQCNLNHSIEAVRRFKNVDLQDVTFTGEKNTKYSTKSNQDGETVYIKMNQNEEEIEAFQMSEVGFKTYIKKQF